MFEIIHRSAWARTIHSECITY